MSAVFLSLVIPLKAAPGSLADNQTTKDLQKIMTIGTDVFTGSYDFNLSYLELASSIETLNPNEETTVFEENFDGGNLPSGWKVQINGVDSPGEVGDCMDGIFSFNCDDDPFFGGLNSNFSGFFAVIDDDAAGSGEVSVKSLTSPTIDLSSYSSNKTLSFAWTFTYIYFNGDDFMSAQAWNGSSWDDLFTTCCSDDNGYETIDISSYSNSDFRLRFVLDDGEGWVYGFGVDSVKITAEGSGGGGSDACFTEDFSDITTGTSTNTNGSNTVWDGNTNFPTVEKAYQAGGAVKLGTGSLTGFIQSRDLTEVSGDITVNIMVKGWTNVEGDLKVSIDSQSQTLSYTAKMSDPFEQITATFTGVAAGSNLKIETTAKRAFIDNVEIICDGGSGGTEDCDQGDDSNGFENGFNIIAGGNFRNADDFFVSAGNTLNVQQIELNVFANAPFATMNFNFFEDDGGKPGTTIVESAANVPVTTVAIGGNFGFTTYATFAEVNLTFAPGHYWMQPEANTGGAAAYWEITTVGSLGDPIVGSTAGGAWTADPDGSQGVFKLHCEAVDPPEEQCLFDITVDVEPITRVVLSDIDNASSPTVNGSPALEDFTSVVGHLTQGTSYDAAFEGNTNGPYTNYFTVWIDFDQSGTYDAGEMFEIGSIVSSTGTDGKQATATIEVPADAPLGTTTMRVIKNYGSSPTNPCGSYAFGQGEDYTIEIQTAGGGTEDCDQGDDSNGFENGFNIIAGGNFRNADDFFVSAGSTLNVQQIELNVFANAPFATMNFNFFEDDGGKPGTTIVESAANVPVTTVAIGGNFGFTTYATFAEVNLTFAPGHYWMQPEANTGGAAAYWEITTVGSLGDPIAGSTAGGAWTADPDGSQGVFKLHCEAVDPPEEQCLFDITVDVEPITRVVLSDIDNPSSPTVNGSPALEDFTSVIGHLTQGTSYDAVFEGNTNGPYTNYFTIWIDFDQSGTYESSEMFEIGSITSSTGTDGKQATATIEVPADAPLGTTTMRVIKNYGSSPTNPCGSYAFGQGEDYTIEIQTAGGGTEDCDQGDDSNGFENGFNIIAGGNFRNADDFFVSAGNTLNVQQIELNVFAAAPFATMNFNFFEDDGGKPGTTIVESAANVPVTTVAIGSNFGYIVYATFAEVNLTFAPGHYWMQPEANTGGAAAFWEITTAGSLGDPIVTSEAGGAWIPDADGSQGVFKLHCEAVDPPEEPCLFDISVDVEPITRVVLSDIDNPSSPTVNGSPALEDFTSVIGHLTQGTSYDAVFEGNTNGPYTNYFTIWIDFDQSGTYESSEMFEIGSITSSTGTDGKQATASIAVPADAPLGTTTMRVIKNYGTSPTNPCGIYSFGQAEDYTVEIAEIGGGGGEDCDQGDDSNGFENGFNIIAGGNFRNADDFFVSAGNTLNVQQIELNVFAATPFATMNFNFFEDDGGKPGTTIVESAANVPVTTVAIGSNFGYIVYATFAEVNLTFAPGHYWMQPEANTGGAAAFWEITTAGSLGDPIVTSEAGGAWIPDADGSQGVFKLHCEPVEPPEEGCLFDIAVNIEPITRVVLSDIDNASSPVVNGSPALEDFTSVIGHLAPGATYEAAFEGNTDGAYTNYFTIWIDFDQNGTYESSEMFEIGSIYNSTGTDGQQAISTITVPSGALLGTTTMRVIKNYDFSPTNPCGIYNYGQGEDYTIVIEELTDCSGTPEGGTVSVNPDHGNPGSAYTVSASGYTIGNGLTYQWQSNTDNAGWVNEGTAMSSYSSYTATAPGEIGSEVEWRLEVTCTNSGETALSTTDIFTVELVYCEPEVLFVEPITRVVFADIDNSSDPNSNVGYEDFTAIVGNVNQTNTYPIALEGNTAGTYTNYFTVWVDWNHNGTFESSEMYEIGSIFNSTGTDGQQATGEITVPADAAIGVTRMRVIKNYSSSPTDPCGSYTFGQIEDYSLNVQSLGTSDMDVYDFSYWPNPVRDILNYSSQRTVRTVDVFNLNGQKVMNSDKVNNGQIDLSTLSPGVYVIKMNFDDGGNKIFKVIRK